MWFAPADILLLFTQFFQFLLIRDLYRTARQLHHAFILEIAQPAGDNLAGIAHVVLSMTDDGCGMDEEMLLHAEEPFYRADKARAF